MQIRVINGTQNNSRQRWLCPTCRFGQISSGRDGRTLILCTGISTDPTSLNFEVTDCNKYLSINRPTLHEMEERAKVIVVDKTGRIGFVSSRKFRDDNSLEAWDRITPSLPGMRDI